MSEYRESYEYTDDQENVNYSILENAEKKKRQQKEDEKSKPSNNALVHSIAMAAKTALGTDDVELVYSATRKRYIAVKDPFLRAELLKLHGHRLSIGLVDEVIARIETFASVSDVRIPTATRFYSPPNNPREAYQDLGNGMCIHLNPDEPKVVSHPDTFLFRLAMGTPLPDPDFDGKPADLRRYLGPGIDDDQISLIIGWMLNVYNVHGSRALLYLSGQEGSGKSTLAQKILHLLDPHGPFELLDQALPNDMEDLGAHIKNMGILSYSNISGAQRWFSDGISQAVTGMQVSNRTKYTNFNLSTAQGKCNAILTGVDFEIDRKDARDRTIRIMLLKHDKTTDEFEMKEKFQDEQRKALGALCNIVCAIMKNYRVLPNTWRSNDRMDSSRYWVECGAKAMTWGDGYYSQIYSERRSKLHSPIPENNSIIMDVIYEFLLNNSDCEGKWTGRYGVIKEYLRIHHGINLSDRAVQAKIDKAMNNLNDVGIDVKMIPARDNNGIAELTLRFTKEEFTRLFPDGHKYEKIDLPSMSGQGS